jgi:hypothetical protein
MVRHREADMGPKPRDAPREVPDSLPKRDQGTDVMPDEVRRTERSRRVPPDSPPRGDDDTPVEGG